MGSDIKKSGRHTNETVTVFYVLNATHEDKTYVMWCQMKALAILRRSIPLFKGLEKKFFSPYFPTVSPSLAQDELWLQKRRKIVRPL